MTAVPEMPIDVKAFATSITAFLQWAQESAGRPAGVQGMVDLLTAHLGTERAALSVVSQSLPGYEQVNLQTALNAWIAESGRHVTVHGVSVPPHWSGLTLQQVLGGEGLPPIRLSAPQLVDLPSGPRGKTLGCMQIGILLVEDDRGPYVMMVRGPEQHQDPNLAVEIVGLEVAKAQEVHAELARLRSALNVYRGHVLELVPDQTGSTTIAFVELPVTERADVVLPETVLRQIERHTVDIASFRDELRAAGQHLKRGLLLFGPPGTGKTHTTRYIVGRMTGYTVLLLSGRSLHLIGAVNELARELQPAVVVLEDVDLVAEDRGFGPGSSPVLFELLDAMDGAASDADLVFLLTTNRADLLEPALAARPGRVDVAVEILLPDAAARRRLLELYGRDVPLDWAEADIDNAVQRTEGTTASFIKELHRRAVLEALQEHSPLHQVTAAHMRRALDDLLDSSAHITRALLGAGQSEGHFSGRAAGGHGGMVSRAGQGVTGGWSAG